MYRCPDCPAAFEHLWRMKKHLKTHRRPYRCGQRGCNKSFADRRNLRIHQRIHSGDRSEKCTLCAMAFSDPTTLRKHLQAVHREGAALKPFVCRKCHKAFGRRALLQAHMLSHLAMNRRADFGCTECEATLSTESNLRRHLRTVHRGGEWANRSHLDTRMLGDIEGKNGGSGGN